MMRIKAKQVAAWEREDLASWFAGAFPERVIGQPSDEVAGFLERRAARAEALGFTRPSHLRYLIGYELNCGVPWMDEGEDRGPSAKVTQALRQRDLTPDQRIEAAERLLYGESDD